MCTVQYRCSGESGGYVYLHGDAARRRGGDGVHGDTQRTAAHTPPTRTPRLTGHGGEDNDGDDTDNTDVMVVVILMLLMILIVILLLFGNVTVVIDVDERNI